MNGVEMRVCPRCGQGHIRSAMTRDQVLSLQMCDECEASWDAGVDPHAEPFLDLRDWLAKHGASRTMTILWPDTA